MGFLKRKFLEFKGKFKESIKRQTAREALREIKEMQASRTPRSFGTAVLRDNSIVIQTGNRKFEFTLTGWHPDQKVTWERTPKGFVIRGADNSLILKPGKYKLRKREKKHSI